MCLDRAKGLCTEAMSRWIPNHSSGSSPASPLEVRVGLGEDGRATHLTALIRKSLLDNSCPWTIKDFE